MSTDCNLIDCDKIALSFKNLGVSTLHPPEPILTNLSGYVVKGGITAVLGASASGKSVLMKVLAGRMQNLHVTGDITLNGVSMDPNDLSNGVSYVPQDDFLMGEFTPRETLKNNYLMKKDFTEETIDEEVAALLKSFGLDHVADNAIGTVFVRGLSGGQRKRVEVCSELIAPHSVLFLDEPTSGLDGSIAFEVISAIKNILEKKNGQLSIMISIHQPNQRILELFNHIMLVGGGGMIFFGTLPESIQYFSSIGFPPPEVYTPTDVFLQVSDVNFRENHNFDFVGNFSCSSYAAELAYTLNALKRNGNKAALMAADKGNNSHQQRSDDSITKHSTSPVELVHDTRVQEYSAEDIKIRNAARIKFPFWRQYWTLLGRDFTLAYRDPALYYLQFVLVSAFGFLVGATFFQLEAAIDSKMNNVGSGMLWIVMMMCYIQVFKVYHLSVADARFKHEISNNTYDTLAFWLAELTASMILLITFIPGTIIAYFMMGLPAEGYPFLMLLFWMTALTAETMLNFITKFSDNATVSIVAGQAVLVILTVFGGGMFIPWDKCPDYWVWLQEISIFTQASRSAMMNVNDFLNYPCDLAGDGNCYGPLGDNFPCDYQAPPDGQCVVSGRMVLHVMQGTAVTVSKWNPFGYLVLIFVVFRFGSLFLMYYPVERLNYMIRDWWNGVQSRAILESKLGLKRVEGQLNAYIALHQKEDEEKGLLSEHRPTGTHHNIAEHESITELFQAESLTKADSLAEGSCLEWKDLTLKLKKNGKVLIDNVSGVALPGRILALMGPSGAGKTTLLNALSNRTPYANVEGQIRFGKRAFTSSDLVYVPQFDEFNANLTVDEQIAFVGEMKCADRVDMRKRLNKLLGILGLVDLMHSRCSDLTSGQLKRVSVGMGMIANPNVLFLDEPTTGLDSSAAYSIVKHLCELSSVTKVVIIMTIHQPAQMVFDMLQDLYLLENGKLAYFGPIPATQHYFKNIGYTCAVGVSPVDFYLDLVNTTPEPQNGQTLTWSEIYYNSTLAKNFQHMITKTVQQSKVANEPPAPPSYGDRMMITLRFFLRYYVREIGIYYLRAGFLIVVALFLGTLFLQLETNTDNISQYTGSVFFNIWAILFSAVAATGLLAADRRQAIEQVKNGVMVPSIYCLSQLIVSIPFDLLCAVTFQCIFHWMINLNPNGESFVFGIFITAGHLLLMEAIMLTVVAVLKNAMLSVTFAMVVLGYLFLFSGFFIAITDMPAWISWICWITPTKYSFDGYLWQVFSDQDFDVSGQTNMVLTGKTFLKNQYDLSDVESWGMFGTLLAWVALFRIAHYVVFTYEVYPYLKKPAADKVVRT